MKGKRRSFTPQYKAEVVGLVRDEGKSISAVARDLELSESAVREWVARSSDKETEHGDAKAPTSPESEEPSTQRDSIDNVAASDTAETVRIRGFVDTIRADFVSGWAWNSQAPEERLEIEILLGETPLGTTRADRMRPDLEANGIGDGKHAFRFVVEDPLSDADQDRIVALARRNASDDPVRVPGVMQQARLARMLVESQQEFADAVANIHRSQAAALDAQKSAAKLHEEIIDLLQGERDREVHELPSLQDDLQQRLGTLEVVQTRFDAALLDLSKLLTEVSAARSSGPRRIIVIAVFLAIVLSGVLGFVLGQNWS